MMNDVRGWKAALSGPLREQSLAAVAHVAERLREPERTLEIAAVAAGQSTLEVPPPWTAISIAYGHPALALLFGQIDRAFPGQGWDRVAHAYLVPAGPGLEQEGPRLSPSLYSGLAGLCFTTHYLSRDGARYQRMLRTLDDLLLGRARLVLRPLEPTADGVQFSNYDLIYGPTGIGLYLLRRSELPEIAPTLDLILDRLIVLSEWQAGRPGFFIPPEHQPEGWRRELYPAGCVDCGLAHGVPGPVGLLALAQIQGWTRPGLEPALRRLADWLAAQAYEDSWGINWPFSVAPHPSEPPDGSTKAGWCYGAPGVARALWLAGRALDDGRLQERALTAMRTVRSRPAAERGLPGPNLCHGVAGLLQIVLRFANDTGDPFFFDFAAELTEELLGMFEPEQSLIGFRDVEIEGRLVDSPGLLNGAAGVALALLAAATEAEPVWDRVFLLS